ncbi:unnamed protein product [Durusdinium trenchii]|uniref:Uncharacterized protein n=1 Tax=Durusdinium trenchii TaxID=1381693 RepID=A0ABP0MP65_9DINO
MGTANGTPREEISIKACGECSAEECQVLLGAMVMAAQVDRTPEHQVDRYGRTGHMHGELEDAVTHDNLTQVLELTAASDTWSGPAKEPWAPVNGIGRPACSKSS